MCCQPGQAAHLLHDPAEEAVQGLQDPHAARQCKGGLSGRQLQSATFIQLGQQDQCMTACNNNNCHSRSKQQHPPPPLTASPDEQVGLWHETAAPCSHLLTQCSAFLTTPEGPSPDEQVDLQQEVAALHGGLHKGAGEGEARRAIASDAPCTASDAPCTWDILRSTHGGKLCNGIRAVGRHLTSLLRSPPLRPAGTPRCDLRSSHLHTPSSQLMRPAGAAQPPPLNTSTSAGTLDAIGGHL